MLNNGEAGVSSSNATSGGNITQRAVEYYNADSLAAQVIRHAERRDRFVVRYLTEQQAISKERINATTAPIEELQNYKGKSRYEVKAQMNEE